MAIMAQATSHAPATARLPRVCTSVPFIILAALNVWGTNTNTNNSTILLHRGDSNSFLHSPYGEVKWELAWERGYIVYVVKEYKSKPNIKQQRL